MGVVFRGLVFSAFGVLLIGLAARDAAACSIELPDPSLVGSPSNGDVDVPLDVVPYYSLQRIRDPLPSRIPLSLVSEDGDEIALTVESDYVNVFEIVPERTLEPNTEYTLSATLRTNPDGTGDDVVDRVTFTTGDGASEDVPEPPDAFLVHYQLGDFPRDSCSPPDSGTCVAFEPGLPVFAQWPGSSDTYLYDAPYFTGRSHVPGGPCLLLRSRAPNGTLSEPVELCGDDAPSYLLGSENIECTSEGLTQEGEVVTSDTANGGTGGTIDAGAAGDTSATAGTGTTGGEPGDQGAEPSDRSVAGCACRTGQASNDSALAVVALLAASVVLRRSGAPRRRILVQ